MKTLHVEKRDLNLRDYTKRSAIETDFKTLITEDTLVCINQRPAILYLKLDWELSELRRSLQRLSYPATTRSSGLKTTSRVFGYQPRIPMRRDFCSATTLQATETKAASLISALGVGIAELYRKHFPDVFAMHQDWTEQRVKEEWKIKSTPFTSGIINRNNPLKYHFDAGNIKDVCSCMLGLKRSVMGGYLSVPELSLGFEICDQSLTIFDGQSLLHGVTPIRKMSGDAYRFTLVFYALHQMWKCEPLTDELARIRTVKTAREKKRAGIKSEAELRVTQHGIEEGEADGD